MTKSNSWIRPDYHDRLRDDLVLHLLDMGSNIKFESDIWFFDKLKRSAGESDHSYTLYFRSIPLPFREVAKYFVIMRYCEKKAVQTINSNLHGLSVFFKYLYENHSMVSLNLIVKQLINEFVLYLKECSCFSKSTKESIYTAVKVFFVTMRDWDVMPPTIPVGRNNPFNRSAHERMVPGKYIPEDITSQLDRIFKDERIPLYERLMYWLLRSIPSRVTEICSMKLDCLKPSFQGEDNWVILIPTWKQSGGYKEPEIRTVHIKYAGHGKFVIDLLREQQRISQLLQHTLEQEMRNMLFTYVPSILNGNIYKSTGAIEYYIRDKGTVVANHVAVRKWFNTISRSYSVISKNGQLYRFTSHQLRHNGITDRYYEGFSLVEIRDMTAQKSDSMVEASYVHDDPEKMIKIQRNVNATDPISNTGKTPVYFNGRILNMDSEQEKRLLANPRANRLGRMGICSDMSNCNPGLFECLDCDFNIPDCNELDYFEEQVMIWTNKIEQFKNHQFMRENVEYNLKLHQHMVDRIKGAIESQKENDHATSVK